MHFGIEESDLTRILYERPKLLPFDHIYPPTTLTLKTPPRTAVLYASISSSNFRELHTHILQLSQSENARVQYVFRPIPDNQKTTRTHLSGYGVTLDLKKTDYLAIDDRLSNKKGSLHYAYSCISH
jgi:UDP-glucose:glycoprotein glucosyltransferase